MNATASDKSARDRISAAIAEGDKARVPGHPRPSRPGRPRKRKPPVISRRALTERLGKEVVTYLDGLTLAQLLCLAYGHIWPIIIPGKGRPKGWRAVIAPEREGAFLITELCVRDEDGSGQLCGTDRTSYEHGIFLERGRRQYRRDKELWKIRPEGSRLTKLDVQDYIYYLTGDALFGDVAEGDGGLG